MINDQEVIIVYIKTFSLQNAFSDYKIIPTSVLKILKTE